MSGGHIVTLPCIPLSVEKHYEQHIRFTVSLSVIAQCVPTCANVATLLALPPFGKVIAVLRLIIVFNWNNTFILQIKDNISLQLSKNPLTCILAC